MNLNQMKQNKVLLGFSLLLVFIVSMQVSAATQVTPTATVVNDETPYSYAHNVVERFRNRFQNLTCNMEFLFNHSRFGEMLGDCNCSEDCNGDMDQLRIRDRIQEMLQICENGTLFQFQNWFRPNE